VQRLKDMKSAKALVDEYVGSNSVAPEVDGLKVDDEDSQETIRKDYLSYVSQEMKAIECGDVRALLAIEDGAEPTQAARRSTPCTVTSTPSTKGKAFARRWPCSCLPCIRARPR
jgi:hypothetical protein